MSKGEFLTRFTVWITLSGYFLGAAFVAVSLATSDFHRFARLARWVWTIGCLALLVHVAFAYHYYHHWSQESVYLDTARQTADVTGINWGGGIYFNYAFMAGWIIDVVWWWRRGLASYRSRPWPLTLAWHAFLLFMVFNAMVVFKAGLMRIVGSILCLAVFLLWWHSIRKGQVDGLVQQ